MANGHKLKGVLAKARRAPRRLSLADVGSVGLPAVYQQFGDQLIYMDGSIFDAGDPGLITEIVHSAGESGQVVGLEFGWQHAAGCACPLCSNDRPAKPAPKPAQTTSALRDSPARH